MKYAVLLLITLVAVLSASAEKIPIAVLDLDAKGEGLSQGVADALTETIRFEFGKQDSVNLVAREKMLALAKEKAIQLTGCTDVSCQVQIGKALNVRKMASGSVVKLGDKYTLFLRVIDVEKENVECNEKEDAGTSTDALDKYVPALVQRVTSCMWVPWCQDLVRQKPDDPKAHTQLGDALLKQGNKDEAVAEFKEAVRLKPDDASIHLDLGKAYFEQNNYQATIDEAREAVRLKPKDAEAHTLISRSYNLQGKYDEGEKEGREAVRLNPRQALAHNAIGVSLKQKGKVDEAITEFREAIRLKPDQYQPHWNLGDIYRDQKKYPEAEKEYRECVRISPRIANAHVGLCRALYYQDKYEEAEKEGLEGIQLAPQWAFAHQSLGQVFTAQHKYDEAKKEYLEANRLDPKDPVIAVLLAIHPAAENQKEEAIKYLTMGANNGWSDWPHLDKQKCWDPLRKDSRFKDLAKVVKKRWEDKQKKEK